MIIGLGTGASSGQVGAMRAAMSGARIAEAGSAASTVLPPSSSVVRLSSSTATPLTDADGPGLYGPRTGNAMEMAQKLRQAADESRHPKAANAQNPMSDVMLMLLIAQAKAYLSSAGDRI